MPAKGTTKISKVRRAEIVAVAEITGNQADAARLAGVCESTVSTLMREPGTRRDAQAIKKEISIAALEIAQKYLKRLGDTVETANVRDAAGAFKLTLEGGLLAGGEATTITQSLDDPARLKELRDLFAAARAQYLAETGNAATAQQLALKELETWGFSSLADEITKSEAVQ